MSPDGTPDISDATKVIEATDKLAATFGKVFPGVTDWSADVHESGRTSRILRDVKKIKAAQKELGLSDEMTDFLSSDAVRRHGRYERFEGIALNAIPSIRSNNRAGEIDSEWAERFFDNASVVYDEEMQKVWSALLAGEANEPGTFSKRTMSILADMSAEDARLFRTLCGYCFVPYTLDGETKNLGETVVILALDGNQTTYNHGAISSKELSTLESFGLVDMSNQRSYDYDQSGPSIYLQTAQGSYTFVSHLGNNLKFIHRYNVLTSAGSELSRLCDLGSAPDFVQAVSDAVKDRYLSVEKVGGYRWR